jgi:hypothetical protein
MIVGRGGQVQLVKIERMCASSVQGAQVQPLPDGLVRAALGHQREHAGFALGELGEGSRLRRRPSS